jgi:hypothetical protein
VKTGLLGIGCLFVVAGVVMAGLTHTLPTRGTAAARPATRPRPAVAVRPTAAARPAPRVVIATVAAPGGGPGAPVADVSALTPVQAYNVTGLRTGPVRIGGTTYTDSVRFTCDSSGRGSAGDLDYVVTGYGSMSATLGIPSDDTHAAGDTMTVAFFNNGSGSQTDGPYTITLGHPRRVHVRFTGSSQLEISCGATAQSGKAAAMDLALANATIGPR